MKRPMSDDDNGSEGAVDLGDIEDDDTHVDIAFEDTESDRQDDVFTHMLKGRW